MHSTSLNHVFRVIWNEASGCWMAVSECAKGRTKSASSKLLRAAVLAGVVGSAAGAVAANTVVDGNAASGCMLMGSGVSLGCHGMPLSNTIYTNFFTEGGSGSGGGAGLGGVFFVNTGASLNLNNVRFLHNVAKGGEGGSTPDVNLSAISITLSGKQAAVSSVSAFRAAPTLALVGGQWQVTGMTLGEDSSLIKAGVVAQLAGGVASTSVQSIVGRAVVFTQPVTLAGSAVAALNAADLTQNSATISAANFAALGSSGVAVGMALVGAGLANGTVITAVNRDAQNVVTSVTLS